MVGLGSAAVVSAALPVVTKAQAAGTKKTLSVGMPKEGPGTPKLAAPLNVSAITDQSMRAVKQLGVDHVLMGGPPMPWTEEQLAASWTMQERRPSGRECLPIVEFGAVQLRHVFMPLFLHTCPSL